LGYILIDAGNSCLKISKLETLDCLEIIYNILDYIDLYSKLMISLQDYPISKVLVCNVNNSIIVDIISNVIDKLWHTKILLVVVQQNKYNLFTNYTNPTCLGVDRWVAMIAARNEFSKTLCVIDCGTAVTIDVISNNGIHLGGLITPGIKILRHSLGLKTNNLPLVESLDIKINNELTLLAINTQDAILDGTLYQLTAYIERMVSEIKQKFGNDIICIITGGDANKIQLLIDHHFYYRETLVLNGIKIVAQDIFSKDAL
jgi:type III pantothenate kinase